MISLLDYSKIKKFWSLKDIIKNEKASHRVGKRYLQFVLRMSDKELSQNM